jgi:hypothetical protein
MCLGVGRPVCVLCDSAGSRDPSVRTATSTMPPRSFCFVSETINCATPDIPSLLNYTRTFVELAMDALASESHPFSPSHILFVCFSSTWSTHFLISDDITRPVQVHPLHPPTPSSMRGLASTESSSVSYLRHSVPKEVFCTSFTFGVSVHPLSPRAPPFLWNASIQTTCPPQEARWKDASQMTPRHHIMHS